MIATLCRCPQEMHEVNAPRPPSLFIAGGITGCAWWQKDFVQQLAHEDVLLVDPRREGFDSLDPKIEREQITWEYRHLCRVNAVAFWFPPETVCPITLFEYGVQISKPTGITGTHDPLLAGHYVHEYKPVFLGVHPDYTRINDLLIQTELARPTIPITHSLEDLVGCVKDWLASLRA